jgi:DNA-binding response OmpR family regulator
MTNTLAIALLMEDEPFISITIEDELGRAGFSVAAVRTCEEAGLWLDGNTPHLAIVDIHLADGSPDAAVRRLVEAGSPFVVHSGDHPSMHRATPFERGIWVSKPAAAGELATIARSLLA